MRKKYTTEEFKNKIIEIFGSKYCVDNVVYKGNKEKIELFCNVLDEKGIPHGTFHIRPNDLMSGHGCKKCGNIKKVENRKKSIDNFLNDANKKHGFKYDYSQVDYKNSTTNICIICPIHGKFSKTPNDHLNGQGCPQCYNENRGKKKKETTRLKVLKKIHELYDDYYLIKDDTYKNYDKNISLICEKHGIFYRTPHTLMNGNCVCEKCKSSSLENEIRKYLLNENVQFEEQKHFDWLGKQSLDFYIPSKNVAIECQGEQHFIPKIYFGGEDGLKKTIKRDEIKCKKCEKHGIKLLYYSNIGIDYPYQVYENKKELLKEILSNEKYIS